jgi:hypothetical protein
MENGFNRKRKSILEGFGARLDWYLKNNGFSGQAGE